MMRNLLFVLVVLTANYSWAQTTPAIDYQAIEDQLKGDGLGGWVHGSVVADQIFVFTWRHPDNFFVNVQFPMAPKDADIAKQIVELRRHDYIVIKGEFIKNKAPIQHIKVNEIVDVKKWTGPGSDLDYDYKTLPKDILTADAKAMKVHAVANQGAVLVCEFQDRVIPVVNSKPELTKDLFRNDKIFVKYKVRGTPLSPTHLEIDYDRPDALLVLERIETGHGEPITLTGPLVMFPKSPQIIFDVYALRTEDQDGIRRNYTLVNFENIDLFMQLRQKLEEAWKANEQTAAYDRNKFINRKIMVTAKGLKNVVDPGQANPQILINSLEDLTVQIIE